MAVLLLVNAYSTHGEPPPFSNYLPPNREDKLNPSVSFNPSSSNLNPNSQPIETSVSFTTNDPVSTFSDTSGRTPSNTYGAPSKNENFSNNRIPTSSGTDGNVNYNAPLNQPPRRGQSSSGGNKGYFYQQPSPTFNEPSGSFSGSQSLPGSQGGYQTGSSGAGSSPTSSSYFSTTSGTSGFTNELSPSLSPTYGAPSSNDQNVGGNFGVKGNSVSSGSNSRNRNFGTPSNALSTSYGPPSINNTNFNGPSTLYGTPANTQASTQGLFDRKNGQPKLPDQYGPPGAFGSSSNSLPSSGSNFDLTGNAPFSSYEPSSSGTRRPSNAFGAQGSPQTLNGPPSFAIDENQSSSGSTSGAFGSPSPSYGPPTNPPQSLRPQGITSSSQNSGRPFDSSGYQNAPNQGRPSLSPSYGSPSPTASGAGYSSASPSSSYSPGSAAPQGGSNQERPSSSYSPSASGEPQRVQNQGRPSSSYGAPSQTISQPGFNQNPQNRRPPSSSYGQSSQNSPGSGFGQSAQNQGRPSSLYGPPQNTPELRPNQIPPNQRPPSSSYGAPSRSPSEIGYSQNAPNQVRPSPTYGSPSPTPQDTGYSQATQNEGRPSPTYGLPSQNTQNEGRPSSSYGFPSQTEQGFSQNPQKQVGPSSSYRPTSSTGTSYDQSTQNQGRPQSAQNPSNSYSSNAPSSLYDLPSNNLNSPSLSSFQGDSLSPYQRPSNEFQPPRFSEPGSSLQSSYGPPRNSAFGSGDAFPTSYESSVPSNSRTPSGAFSIGSSISPSYTDPTSNSFNQGFSAPGSTGFPSASPASGFGPSVSPTYGAPQDFTAGKGPSSGSGNSYTTPSSIGQFSGSKGNTPSSQYGAPANQQNQRPGFSNSFGNPAPTNSARPFVAIGSPSNSYGTPGQISNDFSGGENSPSQAPTSSGFSGTQLEQDIFNTNVASSYLPPSYSEGTGYPSGNSFPSTNPSDDGIVPSTSYTLPSGEPNSPKGGPSNTLKNANRNVGSDLITGASTSPFRPFNDDSPGYPGSNAPSRANYEKSQEIANNELTSTGSDSVSYTIYHSSSTNPHFNHIFSLQSEPAKYEFKYNVKEAGTEFNHQEFRNGSTTSGSYGVVLPDGRKQVVDYEANQEGFHPKIRYEENPSNSIQQGQSSQGQSSQGFGSTQNGGYNYSPANQPTQYPTNQPFSSQSSKDSFGNRGSSPNFNQELQPPYPGNSNYGGSSETQDLYSSNSASTSAQSPYPDSGAIYNTYKSQGTSPNANQQSFNPAGSSYNPNQSSQFDANSQGYNYSPGDSSSQATVYDSSDSQGYPSGPNLKTGGKPNPFFT